MTERCPKCNSPQPHLHPATQHEGEVNFCTDSYHLKRTPENKPEYIDAVLEKKRGTNGGIWCDVKSGPCACGAFH